jgi:predicted RNA-binding Zn-ribbon protein involved in translation (DUF1610 family)
MDRMRVSEGPRFIYLLVFVCPECGGILISPDRGDAEKTEQELRSHNYPVACNKCRFKGVLVGSEIKHFVELEWIR